MHDVPVIVRQDLHLDMPAEFNVFLDINRGILKRVFRLGLRLLQPGSQRDIVVRHAHSPPAAARGRLDDDGISDLRRQLDRRLFIIDRPIAAGHGRHLRLFCQLFARDLVSHRRHRRHRRPDEFDLAASAHLGEMIVFRQKSIPRMNRLHIRDLRGRDDAGNIQITFRRRGVADADRLIRQLQISRVFVRRRINHRRLHAHLPAGADDPQCDFSAIGNQNFRKHVNRDPTAHLAINRRRQKTEMMRTMNQMKPHEILMLDSTLASDADRIRP